jgi:hypothetical protein
LGIGFGLGDWGQWGLDPRKLDRIREEEGKKGQRKGNREKWEFIVWPWALYEWENCKITV